MPRYGHKPRTQFKSVEAGMHVAWLVQFIDLGTHPEMTQWGTKNVRKGRFVWALPDMLMDDGRPMTIGTTMALSPHEKANFRKMCQKWLARSFTDGQFLDFDERELFNVPCLINVAHKDAEDGGVYAIVQDWSPLLRNMVANELPAGTPYIYVSLFPDRFDANEYAKLDTLFERQRDDLKGKIETSPEWADLQNGGQEQPADDNWQTEDPLPAAGDQQDVDDSMGANPDWPEEPAQAHAPVQQRPAAPQQQARPQAPQQQRQQAPQQQRPAAPQQQMRQPAQQAPQQRPMTQAQAPQRPSGPAPQRPMPGPNSNSARATGGRPAAPQTRPMQAPGNRQMRTDPDIGPDEIPW